MLRFMPATGADVTLDILGQPSAAEQRVSPDAGTIPGRPARTFADWATGQVAVGAFS